MTSHNMQSVAVSSFATAMLVFPPLLPSETEAIAKDLQRARKKAMIDIQHEAILDTLEGLGSELHPNRVLEIHRQVSD